MFTGQIMTRKVFTIAPDRRVEDAFLIMLQKKIGHLPVLKGRKLIGVVSDRDLRKAVAARRGGKKKDLTVADVMSRDLVTIRPGDEVTEAVKTILRHRVGCLPVVESGRLKGIITKDDLLSVFSVMLRSISSTATIDVEFRDEVEDGAAVMAALRKARAPVISFSTAPRGKNGPLLCHIRLKLCPVKPIIRELEKRGVTVLEAYGDD